MGESRHTAERTAKPGDAAARRPAKPRDAAARRPAKPRDAAAERRWGAHEGRPLPALLNEAKDIVIAELHARLGEEGFPEIRPGHGRVLRFIEPDGSRLTDVAEQAGLTKQAAGEVVSDLESLGHLERCACPNDGRAKIITLTDRGRACVEAAERIFADIEERWAREVGERRVATLRAVLEEITEREPAEAAAR